MRARSLAMSFGLAAAWLTSVVPSASAECLNAPIGPDDQPEVAIAFSGRVERIVEGRDPRVPDKASYRQWTTTVGVDRTYRGRHAPTVQLQETNTGCSFLYLGAMAEGDRIFLASERLEPGDAESDLGNVFVWKLIHGRWRFYEDALRDGPDSDFYPTAVRSAASTNDILRSLSMAPMPDTATSFVSTGQAPTVPAPAARVAVAVFAGIIFVVALMTSAKVRRPT